MGLFDKLFRKKENEEIKEQVDQEKDKLSLIKLIIQKKFMKF